MTTRELLSAAWDPGLAVSLLCVAALVIYGTRFRARLVPRAGHFVAAVAIFFLALASPIGVLARGYLFSAHMLQHLLLLLAVPPLVLLGLPRDTKVGAGGRPGGAIRYVGPWLAGVGAMWIWHEPTLCNAAAGSGGVQWLQTASLVGLGLWFWRPILAPRVQDRFPPFAAILYLFAACVACTVLGILVTFSPVEVCSIYLRPVDRLGALPLLRDGWGLTPSADQQVGGLMMWVPACIVYAAAILATLARYYREEGRSPRAVGERHASVEAR
jgi:cytochrome c oxidase assembly factor CtaG